MNSSILPVILSQNAATLSGRSMMKSNNLSSSLSRNCQKVIFFLLFLFPRFPDLRSSFSASDFFTVSAEVFSEISFSDFSLVFPFDFSSDFSFLSSSASSDVRISSESLRNFFPDFFWEFFSSYSFSFCSFLFLRS